MTPKRTRKRTQKRNDERKHEKAQQNAEIFDFEIFVPDIKKYKQLKTILDQKVTELKDFYSIDRDIGYENIEQLVSFTDDNIEDPQEIKDLKVEVGKLFLRLNMPVNHSINKTLAQLPFEQLKIFLEMYNVVFSGRIINFQTILYVFMCGFVMAQANLDFKKIKLNIISEDDENGNDSK